MEKKTSTAKKSVTKTLVKPPAKPKVKPSVKPKVKPTPPQQVTLPESAYSKTFLLGILSKAFQADAQRVKSYSAQMGKTDKITETRGRLTAWSDFERWLNGEEGALD